MHFFDQMPQQIHRRTFLRTGTACIGTAVLASLLKPDIGALASRSTLHAAERGRFSTNGQASCSRCITPPR